MRRVKQQSVLGGAIAGALTSAASAQQGLRPDQVLVVYDSRLNDSLRVAEYYAGSAKVPGGVGGLTGSRPNVRVVNLAPLTGWFSSPGETHYFAFTQAFRDPLKAWLNTHDPRGHIRCLVLTKGFPHRIQDTDNAGLGDSPFAAHTELLVGDATYVSVDSELTLLQRSLDHSNETGPVTEAGNPGDSFADGLIINPYHNAALPITAWSTVNRRVNRSWNNAAVGTFNLGAIYISRTTPAIQVFTPGDHYLVCRLDGHTLADVFAMIDHGRAGYVDLSSVAVVLDESASNALPDAAPNNELDNADFSDAGNSVSFLRLGDDYERTRDLIAADGRLLPANLVYNAFNPPSGYIVGPRINFGGGTVESRDVLLLASEASNAILAGSGPPPGTSGRDLPLSFNWAPMGMYNSIESYNGRAFGGLPTFIGQSQVADAVGAGATFGLGNVYEPFAFAIPDNEPIARRFYFGRLTFAEAAYAAFPALSWQQLAIGDPLARVQRSTEDINADLRVDIEDLYRWEALLAAGAGVNVNHLGGVDDTDRQLVDQSPRPIDHIDMAGLQRP